MRRTLLPILLIPFLTLATTLMAQDGFSGRFLFATAPGNSPLMTLDLTDRDGTVTGLGQTLPAMPGVGATLAQVTAGASHRGNLQLELTLAPLAGGGPVVQARFQLIEGAGAAASLAFGGQTVTGVFVADLAGVVPLAQPQVQPPARPQIDAVCQDMETLGQRLTDTADSDILQAIRAIYTDAGLAFGGTRTPGRCTRALAALQGLAADPDAGAVLGGTANCDALGARLSEVWIALEPLGGRESGELEAILAGAGLQVPGLNPGGFWNETTCGRALPEVGAYLVRVRAIPQGGLESAPDITPQAMVVLPVRGFAPADGGADVELWSHVGSQLVFETGGPGNAVSIWYWVPQPGLQQIGVQQGTRLFAGVQAGTRMLGEAQMFTADCGAYGYPVGADWFDGSANLVLRGQRPVVGADCRITGTESTDIAMRFESFALPGAVPEVVVRPQVETQIQPQIQPPSPGGVDSTGIVLSPLGAATITSADPIRQQPQTPPVDDADEREPFDTPGFGVWAEVYEVYDVRDTLNLRAGPGTGFDVIDVLPRFARDILVTGAGCTPDLDQIGFSDMSLAGQTEVLSTRWCNIDWNGRRGWVSGRYLRPY